MKKIFSTLAGKWPEYLLEIFVITIGILGAYALNSWKNQNADSRQEQLILEGLKKNIIFNIEEVERRAIRCEEAYYASTRLVELTNPGAKDVSNKEIDSLISIMIYFATYDPATGTIDEIINSGQLQLIQNEELKDKLTNWSRLIIDAGKDATITMDHLFNILLPFVAEKGNLSNTPLPEDILKGSGLSRIPASSFPADYDKLMTSSKLESLASIHAWNLMSMVYEYRKVQQYMQEMLVLIESEIEAS